MIPVRRTAEAFLPVVPPPAIAGVPRAVTGRVRWRSWIEPRVRFWWVVAAIFLAVSAYFLAHGIYAWHHENWLLRQGTPIAATVEEVAAGGNETGGIKDKRQPPDGRVIGHYTVDGQVHTMVGWLKGRTEWIVIGSDVPICVNPADPDDWTGITSPIRLIDEDDVIHGLGVFPIALLLAVVAVYWRRRLLRLWKRGNAVEATVLESRISAMAPRLRELRCAPELDGQHRVQRVFSPPQLAAPAPGERLWLLCEPDEKWAVAAAWFE
jgi:hypothetical protein